MPDLLYIANAALGLCAQGQITALDDGTPNARAANLHILPAIREVLESGYWKCAKKQANPALLTAVPLYGWDYAFQLPSDYLRMYKFNDIYVDDFTPETFDRQGNSLLCQSDTAYLTYIADLGMNGNDVGLMSPAVADLCVVKLAQKMCWGFTQSRTLRESLLQEYTIKERRAKVTDALESKRPQRNPQTGSRWIGNRFSSTQVTS